MHPSILKCKTCSTYDLLSELSINRRPSIRLLLWIFTIYFISFDYSFLSVFFFFVRRIINAVGVSETFPKKLTLLNSFSSTSLHLVGFD